MDLRLHILSLLLFICFTSIHADHTATYNGSIYAFLASTKTFDNAESDCVFRGGHLASAHSAEEFQFMNNIVTNTSLNLPINLWIGLYIDTDHDGGAADRLLWKWTDGTTMDYIAGWGHQDEPQMTERCARHSRSQQGWVGTPSCNDTYGSICKDVTDTPTTTVSTTLSTTPTTTSSTTTPTTSSTTTPTPTTSSTSTPTSTSSTTDTSTTTTATSSTTTPASMSSDASTTSTTTTAAEGTTKAGSSTDDDDDDIDLAKEIHSSSPAAPVSSLVAISVVLGLVLVVFSIVAALLYKRISHLSRDRQHQYIADGPQENAENHQYENTELTYQDLNSKTKVNNAEEEGRVYQDIINTYAYTNAGAMQK